ncbi:hypothetical protein HZA73_03765 [candidate division TA06 bacterium]|nr:hypothetical protein [candidate division TA06 bacterium]
MKRKTLALLLVLLSISTMAMAVNYWCYGNAKTGVSTYLTGWTIKCEEGTYGTYTAGSNGYFEMVYYYYWTPPAGYYRLTADSTGKARLTSTRFYYSGSGSLSLGTISFSRLAEEE